MPKEHLSTSSVRESPLRPLCLGVTFVGRHTYDREDEWGRPRWDLDPRWLGLLTRSKPDERKRC